MRLFVAIDIDDATRAQLAAARAAMQSVLDQARVPPRVTWVKDENAHVTLRFIGETPESTAAKIQQALMSGFGVAPFEVCWEHLGAFPNQRRPRIVWIGPQTADDLITLAAKIEKRLEPLIGASEPRPFTPHLTLGRVKENGIGVDWARALTIRSWAKTTTWIDHVTLFQSRSSAKGPTYTALCQAPL